MGYFVNKLRTALWSIFYLLLGRLFFTKMGRNCRFEGWIDIPQRGGKIVLEDDVFVCKGVEFSVPKGGSLTIGRGSSIGRGVLMSAHCRIDIGRSVMIAEYVCIHDNNHRFEDAASAISSQGFSAKPISIGDGCWIGAHVAILEGVEIGRESIVGTGSVVTRSVPELVVAVGAPCRVLRHR